MRADITIYGQGFYTLTATSKAGHAWMSEHVEDYNALPRTAHSDDRRMTQEIADAAHRIGLQVIVNGLQYPAK